MPFATMQLDAAGSSATGLIYFLLVLVALIVFYFLIGKGIFLDHATGLVVGETSVIDDDVSILQNVTLGGTGHETGDRHPKVRRGVMIGAGSKILGNIEVGANSRIAAGSLVLHPVPPNTTMAGVPARAVGTSGSPEPSRSMDQILSQMMYDSFTYTI